MESTDALKAVETYKQARQRVSQACREVEEAEKAYQDAEKPGEALLDLARKEEALEKAKLAKEEARQVLVKNFDDRSFEEIVEVDTYIRRPRGFGRRRCMK